MISVPEVTSKAADRLGTVFYVTVAGIALVGQTIAAREWLGLPLIGAALAVAALELGGVALAVRADFRRRLGETALAARLLSGAVAVFAVVFNWLGHSHHLQGGFYAGMSALGYGVWLINSGDRRRDQLRAIGKLEDTAPVYGPYLWVRRFALTRRARSLALSDPSLGKMGSLAAAREQIRVERRTAAISTALRKRIAEHVDPTMAEIAVQTYDLDEIAERLAAGADYDGLTAILAAELVPARIAPVLDRPVKQPAAVEPAAAEPEPVIEPVPEREPAAVEAPALPIVLAPFELPVPARVVEPEPVVTVALEVPAAPDQGTVPVPPVETGRHSRGRSVSVAGLSGTAAIEVAQAELRADASAGDIVAWLAERGVMVSQSLVYKVRKAHTAPEVIAPEVSVPADRMNGRPALKAV